MRASFHFLVPLAALPAFALAGCGKSDTVTAENESVASVAKKVAESDVRPRAGRWESTMTMDQIDMPEMPPEAALAMKQAVGGTTKIVTCLTPEEAAKPDADYLRNVEDPGCKYDKFTMGGGKIASAMTCDMGNGGKRTMTVTGTYSPDAYMMNVKSEGAVAEGMPGSMTMTINSRRVGECDGTELGAKTK